MASKYTEGRFTPPQESLKESGLIVGKGMASYYLIASERDLKEDATRNLWGVILIHNFPFDPNNGYHLQDDVYPSNLNKKQVDAVLVQFTENGKTVRLIISEYKRAGRNTSYERQRNEEQLAEYCHDYFQQEKTPSYCFAMSAIGTYAKLFTLRKEKDALQAL
ncbi:MAG: hypothetical protein M1835_002247 [Candelina submexicana]|nr:MAG: hypothetical protein M1835_002247 [Candelina submexicana]